jgi:hypothetical protein
MTVLVPDLVFTSSGGEEGGSDVYLEDGHSSSSFSVTLYRLQMSIVPR